MGKHIYLFILLNFNIWGLDVGSFIIKKDNSTNLILKWNPKQYTTKYEIFKKSKTDLIYTKISTLNSITESDTIYKILGNKLDFYLEAFNCVTKDEFIQKLTFKKLDSKVNILYYSYYDADIAKIINTSYIENLDVDTHNNIEYLIIAYVNNKEIDRGTISVDKHQIIEAKPPSKIKLTPANQTISIEWEDNIDKGILGYNIYLSTDDSKNFVKQNDKLVSISKASLSSKKNIGNFLISTLKNNQIYYIKLTSVYINNIESNFTNVLSAMPILVEKIKVPILKLEQIIYQPNVLLSWEKGNYKKQIIFNIYRSTESLSDYKKINIIPIPSSIHEYRDDTILTYEKTYWYYIEIEDGEIKNKSNPIFIKIKNNIQPLAPIITKIVPKLNSIDIEVNVDKALFRYQVFRSINNGSFDKIAEIEPSTSIYTDTKLSSKITYCYKIISIDKFTNFSTPSFVECASSLNIEIPYPPKDLFLYTNSMSITLEWKSNSNIGVKAYNIYRRENNISIFKKINTISYLKNNWVDNNINFNTEYSYYIASLSEQNIESKPSLIVKGVVKSIKPTPVYGIKGYFLKTGGYLISWDSYNDIKTSYKIIAYNINTNKQIILTTNNYDRSYLWKTPIKGKYKLSIFAMNEYKDTSDSNQELNIEIN